MREKAEEKQGLTLSDMLGWRTTTKSRKPLVADLVKVVDEGEIKIYDRRIIDEMRVFVTNELGKPEAQTGEHDDGVLATGGVIQIHQRTPMSPVEATVFKNKESIPGHLVAGGVDTDDSDDTGEYDSLY